MAPEEGRRGKQRPRGLTAYRSACEPLGLAAATDSPQIPRATPSLLVHSFQLRTGSELFGLLVSQIDRYALQKLVWPAQRHRGKLGVEPDAGRGWGLMRRQWYATDSVRCRRHNAAVAVGVWLLVAAALLVSDFAAWIWASVLGA
jgi:hypothetical protein